MATVSLDNVRKVYPDGHIAVAGASFEVGNGELLVLVGPSGCGKTTLLRMIAGLETLTAGSLRIGARVVNEVAPKDRDIAMVFQNYALYPHMTVAENLGFGLRLRGTSRAEIAQRVSEVARLLELETKLDVRPAALSGGQRQRVALGRAMVRQPAVFLLDEPLSNLDARLRLAMRVEIARLHKRFCTTTIYVTHDQVEAMTLGQRIVVLNHGAIQQIDTPINVYRRPANLFVASFLGSPAMNFLHGTLSIAEGFALATAHGTIKLGALPQAPVLDAWRERRVVLGLRPEHLLPLAGDNGDAVLEAKLEVVERVGNEEFLHLRHGTEPLVSRAPPDTAAEPGATMRFGIDAAHLHWFDPDTGARIDDMGPAGQNT
ncbi:sn-glycerol-3-phosphate ABC transporter ATP-binding protein UgpC [Rhodanobacter glycinis]|uniref:sn-glycerol-3-phosphate ABC transporter ATP-binding protein UgpC n=1 Tax=Rhodanobacter glycinis TaxID=582702 RepID=A0A5B9DZC0_9GAMM|nr:sn-glycerol-3-phosphate ABC transporter ATP-binding protein UgpC [Rhodanobacter glycinis]QEE23347.1 sn-glycerol-3-phosphate ABC transporter ATP-binding protein UgpC [Rhodanobacter glycinis]